MAAAPAAAGGKLTTEPAEKVEFKGSWEEPVVVEMKVVNSSGKRMAYKVKCTSNELFKIRPVMGILGDGESVAAALTFSPKDKKPLQKNARKVWEAEEAKKALAAKKIKAEFASAEGAAAAPAAAGGEAKPAEGGKKKPKEPANPPRRRRRRRRNEPPPPLHPLPCSAVHPLSSHCVTLLSY